MASQVLYDLSVSLVAVQQMTHIKGNKVHVTESRVQ